MSDKKIKVLYASAEADPLAVCGGLGDVAGALPRALCSLGADVRVVMPMYTAIDRRIIGQAEKLTEFTVPLSWRRQQCAVYTLTYGGVFFYLIDNKYYFDRRTVYGCYDDGERFAFFSRALVEMIAHIDFEPDILHTNDWHSAAACVYLKKMCCSTRRYSGIRCVHTVHNAEYQGIFGGQTLDDVFGLESAADVLMQDGCVNLTRGAALCCDRLTCVSQSGRSELLTDEGGAGLGAVFRACEDKLYGISNGIDSESFNPATDAELPCRYDASDPGGKFCCKAELQRRLVLPGRCDVPMIAVISRLTEQKGMTLLLEALPELLEKDIQLVLLGTGDTEYEMEFRDASFRCHDRLAAVIRFDRPLSRLIYAGADILLMPSRSEQCGISQMIASRYGTVPLVHSVGGLKDTVSRYDTDSGEGTGFAFEKFDSPAMLDELYRALKLFDYDRTAWNSLVSRIMKRDFSWDASAKKYLALYRELTERSFLKRKYRKEKI